MDKEIHNKCDGCKKCDKYIELYYAVGDFKAEVNKLGFDIEMKNVENTLELTITSKKNKDV